MNGITSNLSVPVAPANFGEWPACMQRRYREHALARSTRTGQAGPGGAAEVVTGMKPTPVPGAISRS